MKCFRNECQKSGNAWSRFALIKISLRRIEIPRAMWTVTLRLSGRNAFRRAFQRRIKVSESERKKSKAAWAICSALKTQASENCTKGIESLPEHCFNQDICEILLYIRSLNLRLHHSSKQGPKGTSKTAKAQLKNRKMEQLLELTLMNQI